MHCCRNFIFDRKTAFIIVKTVLRSKLHFRPVQTVFQGEISFMLEKLVSERKWDFQAVNEVFFVKPLLRSYIQFYAGKSVFF